MNDTLTGEIDQTVEAAKTRPSFFSKIFAKLRFPYRADGLFSLVFFTTIFVPLTFFSYLGDGYELPKLALWLIVTGLAIFIVIKKRTTVPNFPKVSSAILWLFIGSAILSTVFSMDIMNSIFGLYSRFTSGLLFYTLWAAWIVIVYKSLSNDKLEFLIKTINSSGLLVAVLGILQQQEIAFYAGVEAQARSLAPSFLGNPNFSSMYLVAIVPMALYGFFNSSKRFVKYYYAICAVLMIWAIMAFSSRGAILGLGASLVVFAAMHLWKHRTWFSFGTIVITAIVTTLLFLGFFSAYRPGVVAETFALNNNTVSFRFFAWGDTAEIINKYPVFGTGHGNYYLAFKELGDSALSSGERFDDAHNLYMHIIATGGIPFAIIFALILALAIACGVTAYNNSVFEKQATMLLAGLIGWMVVVNFNPVTIACWLILAFLVAGLFYIRYSSESTPTALNNKWKNLIVGVLAGFFILYGLVLITSEVLTFQGTKAYRYYNYPKAEKLLRASVYINPNGTSSLNYWAAARIKQKRDPLLTDRIITFMVKLHPKSSGLLQTADTLYYMLYRQTGQATYKDKAYTAMQMTLVREPNFANVLGHQAYMYFKFEDYELARKYVNYTLVTTDTQFYTWLLSAQLYKQAGMREQMLLCIKKAITLQPDVVLFKVFYDQAINTKDINALTIPINFADPEIQ